VTPESSSSLPRARSLSFPFSLPVPFSFSLIFILFFTFLLFTAGVAPTTAQEQEPLLEPEGLVGAPAGTPLEGKALDARTQEVGSLLRCPVCQGLSVADSPASMAVNMKAQVRQMLARGYSEEQILAYFEGSYGEFVRLEPPLRGVNWLVWLAPLAALLLGGVVVARALRARGATVPAAGAAEAGAGSGTAVRAGEATDVPTRTTLPDDPALARGVLRVREMAYGWPGGIPPGEPR
jgi:cytochrome c-type biogenesis protein CcmH